MTRAFLGLFEGGLWPGIALFLSMVYKREEIALRLGIVYCMVPLCGAFSGLLASAIFNIGTRSGLAPWRWILILEGIASSLVGLIAYFALPVTLEKAKFLTEKERTYAIERLAPPFIPAPMSLGSSESRLKWESIRRAILSVRTLLAASISFLSLAALQSLQIYIPTMIQSLGHSAIDAQLWSVPPFAVAVVVTIGTALVSDRYRLRGPVILAILPVAIAGYALMFCTTDNNVKYGALFMMVSAICAVNPPVITWLANNFTDHYAQATAIALQIMVGCVFSPVNACGYAWGPVADRDHGLTRRVQMRVA